MRTETLTLLIVISLALVAGLVNFQRASRPWRVLLVLVACTLVAESLAEYFAHRYHNNLVVYHVFHPLEYSLLALVFRDLIGNRTLKTVILVSILLYMPFSILNSLYWERVAENQINITAILVQSILLVWFALQVLFEFLRQPVYENIYPKPSFWLSMGVLIFFATNIFFWGYYNRLSDNERGVQVFYKILFYENLLLYFLMAVALTLVRFAQSRPDRIPSRKTLEHV